MKLVISPRQAQFLGRILRRGTKAAEIKKITPPGWNTGPITSKLLGVDKLKLWGGELHHLGLYDAAENKVGYALLRKKHGKATVNMIRHYQDEVGSTSSPLGPKEFLGLKRKFVKDNPDVHTFAFDRVYQPGTHENFKTKRFWRWHGLKIRTQTVPVKGREALAKAEQVRVRNRNISVGVGVGTGIGTSAAVLHRTRRDRTA